MPLSCLDPHGTRIQAFDLDDAAWRVLRTGNSQKRHLRMTCCPAEVVLKQSARGTRFFSHKRTGACTTGDESEAHRHLKLLAVEAARAAGWHAETEVCGACPEGGQWRADVLATKGKSRVAIEIQWSGQTEDETLRRQRQYQSAGVRGLWLLRQPRFPVLHGLPAVCVGGSLSEGFIALLPHARRRMTRADRVDQGQWRQAVPMAEFLRAALERRLRWGTAVDVFGASVQVDIREARQACWHDSCDARTDIVTAVTLSNPGMCLEFSLADVGEYPSVADRIVGSLPSEPQWQHIKPRYSRTQKRTYLSNGCSGCGRLFGEYMQLRDPERERVVSSFSVDLDSDWLRLAMSHPEFSAADREWWLTGKETAG